MPFTANYTTIFTLSFSQPVGCEPLNKGSHRPDLIKSICTDKPFI